MKKDPPTDFSTEGSSVIRNLELAIGFEPTT